MIRNVIFDLGGVVFEWDPDGIIRAVFDDANVQARIKAQVFAHPDWAETDRGTLSEADAIVRWAARTGRTEAEMDALMRATEARLRVKADTIALMDELIARGLTLFCLSNMPIERYDYLHRTHDFWDKFHGIVISGHIKMLKPAPEIYQHLLYTYKLDASECVFLDDMPDNIAAARALGIHGLVFTSADACRQQIEQLIITAAEIPS